MKKILALILITFSVQSQTLVKLKQLERAATAGSLIITGASGIPEYTSTINYSSITGTPVLTGSYVPYSGATTSVNLGANSLSVGTIGYVTQTLNVGPGSHTNNPGAILSVYNATGAAISSISSGTNTGNTQLYFNAANPSSATSFYHFPSTTAESTGSLVAPNSFYIEGFGKQFAINNTHSTNGEIKFGINNVERVRITRNGNLGINQTAPTATLHVGGTMSISSTATVNGLTNLSNMTTTGTGSIGSTFTVNGAMLANSTLSVAGNASVVGTFSAGSTTTLNAGVKINGTLTVGNTSTLTGGNSGTIAVLSDAIFPVQMGFAANNPSDGANVYFGITQALDLKITATGSVTLPYNCNLVAWTYSSFTGGTLGSSETTTLSIRGTTNYTLSTSIAYTAINQQNTGSSLNVSFNAGDSFQINHLCPTWATNPTNVAAGLVLWFVRRL